MSSGESTSTPGNNHPTRSSINDDRKYNLIFRGVAEQSNGTPRAVRLRSDYNAIVSIIDDLDTGSECIYLLCDCRRIGRYSRDSRSSRPILATFSSTADVCRVLSLCRNLPSSISVHPDLSLQQRRERSILLQERRKLINSGIRRDTLRIKGSCIHVSGVIAGRVLNSAFVYDQTFNNPVLNDAVAPVTESPSSLSHVNVSPDSASLGNDPPLSNDSNEPVSSPATAPSS